LIWANSDLGRPINSKISYLEGLRSHDRESLRCLPSQNLAGRQTCKAIFLPSIGIFTSKKSLN
jgi:hypothetical protein